MRVVAMFKEKEEFRLGMFDVCDANSCLKDANEK
jgi:hypothetical protein